MNSWQKLAESLGFASEKEMLEKMYGEFGLLELSRKFAVSHYSLRKRLVHHGIPIRGRGGPHATKLEEFTEELLERMKTEAIAERAHARGGTKFTLFNRRKKYLEENGLTLDPDAPSSSDSRPASRSPHPTDTGDAAASTTPPEDGDALTSSGTSRS